MPMTNSAKGDEWVDAVVKANPIHIAPNGNIITCPVRLHYVNAFQPARPGPNDPPDKQMKYGVTPLFPPQATGQFEQVIKPVLMKAAHASFASRYDADEDRFNGVHFPVHRQDEKLEHQGFTKGGLYVNVTSKFMPSVVDTAMNDVTDPSKAYNGVWAILALNTYTYDDPRKRGVSLGLQMIMLFADDTRLASNKADPKKAFAGVKIDSAFNPSDAFGTGAVRTGPTGSDPGSVLPDAQKVSNSSGGLW